MCCFLFPLVIDDLADNRYLLPSIRAADIVECVCMWMELSQNLQSVSPYYPCPPTVFSSFRIMVKQVKSSSQTS